ncbi:hypothetical protein GKO32_37800 [Amycolatopsis sp. RM579]|uniref:HpcH/HpaI aldolase/citrate lyase domain-containing protein n=1 Tax=Amycolatopsis pithecellobii TaxID=664692 RepID=A0A6N7ZDD6_9PSEU|nr:hypothetical protein [Amycolatopsis pithecellobii]
MFRSATGVVEACSVLFVPAYRPELFEKAYRSGVDAIVIDLEDGVADAPEGNAREHAQEWSERRDGRCSDQRTRHRMVRGRPQDGAGVPQSGDAAEGTERCRCARSNERSATATWHWTLALTARHGRHYYRRDRPSSRRRRPPRSPAPLDGATTSLTDQEILRQDSIHARTLGFTGRICPHPQQVRLVNDVFTPVTTKQTTPAQYWRKLMAGRSRPWTTS